MLVRVSGGASGIKEYLEDGRKQGRGQSRDELDERVILNGDLELTDLVIEGMRSEGDKYLHVTLAFKEDHVDRETLSAIVDEFRAFAFAAYREDEYTFYAEAHLPRVKSYLDAQSGDLVERKPHIHIVIPLSNALSGTRLEPFGVVERQIQYLDAWQEHINDKYGLASPKDNRRVEFTSESEIISRHKGDLFDAQGKSLKTRILDAVLDRDIRDLDQFRALLEEMGERRTRNPGKDSAYENLKLPDAPRGLNLKDGVFSREFIELPLHDKQSRLIQDLRPHYESAGQSRATSQERLQLLDHWREIRSREIKYLNSGNRRAWREYHDAEPEKQRAILDARAVRFYDKHDKEMAHDRAQPNPAYERPEPDYPLKNGRPLPREPGAQRSSERDPGGAPLLSEAPTLDSLPSLSSVDVVRDAEDGAVLLPDHAADHVEHRGAEPDHPLRRDAPGADGRGVGQPDPVPEHRGGRPSDSVAAQYLRDTREERAQAHTEAHPDWQVLKTHLDARGLLADLSRSHGVQVEKYDVLQAEDGGHRIRAGARLLNVNDFLTKELHLSWREAEPILRQAWVRQREQQRDPSREQHAGRPPLAAPNPAMWRSFTKDRRDRLASEKAMTRQEAQTGYRLSRRDIVGAYQEARRKAATLPPTQRRAALSVARMSRVAAEQQLREATRQQRSRQREWRQAPMLDQYRAYLHGRAEQGDARALAELRRVAAPGQATVDKPEGWVLAGDDEQARRARAALYNPAALRYTVERNGDVAYQVDGRAVIRDTARRIDVLTHDADVIETALRLAQQRFGQRLTLSGSTAWQEKVARTAGERGLQVSFTDARLNQIALDRARELTQKPPGRGQEPDRGIER